MPVRVSGGAVDSMFGCCARSVLLVLHAFALPCACAWCVFAGSSQLRVGEIVESGETGTGTAHALIYGRTCRHWYRCGHDMYTNTHIMCRRTHAHAVAARALIRIRIKALRCGR